MAPNAIERVSSLIERFVAACQKDDRIVAAILGGSHARGEADDHSDVDLCVIARDDVFEDLVADRDALVRQLGDPLFLEDFGLTAIVFFILADGTEGEIFFGNADRLDEIHAGPYRTLFDPQGILDAVSFPDERADPAEQERALRQIVTWFWHDLSHFIVAMGRGQLWWASGQLEALRGYHVNLVRIERGVEASDEPYEKIDTQIPAGDLSPLEATFVPLRREDLLDAARTVVDSFRERAQAMAREHGIAYPIDLDRVLRTRFEAL